MDSKAIDRDAWEKKLHDPTATPISLPFEFLKLITSNFSDHREIGRGGYGVVYRGVLRSGKFIAVKKLFEMHLVDDRQFQKEVTNIIGIKHENIVPLVGYCAESRWEVVKLPSRTVMAQIPTRLLCFEYLSNKSLDKHVSDESSGLDWNMRYEIIKGICCGLHYLHRECHIVHLDLKPENILIDDTMKPKIADFGLSRLLGTQKSRTIISKNPAGSLGYMAPEYLMKGVISHKADIFSLGAIIIEIMTGAKEYPMATTPYFQQSNEHGNGQNSECSQQQYAEKVLDKWRNVFENEPKYMSEKIYMEQVHHCITIALQCLDLDPTGRPDTCVIFQILTGIICSCQKTWLLSTRPFELRFNFKEKHEVSFCSLHLTNNTDDEVAFRIFTDYRDMYFPYPVYGRLLPRSDYTLRVAMLLPPGDDNHFILELHSTLLRDPYQLPHVETFGSEWNYNHFFTEAEDEGREVQRVKLLFLIEREYEEDQKPNELKEVTLILKICLDGEGFVDQIRHHIFSSKGVTDIVIDAANHLVKVTGTLETAMELGNSTDMFGRPVKVFFPGMEKGFVIPPKTFNPFGSLDYFALFPQEKKFEVMFSDENPNAFCSIM